MLKISFNNVVKSTAASTPVFTYSFVSSTKLYLVLLELSTDNRSALLFIHALNTYHCYRIELDLIKRNRHSENKLDISIYPVGLDNTNGVAILFLHDSSFD